MKVKVKVCNCCLWQWLDSTSKNFSSLDGLTVSGAGTCVS
jgi:hypothetical protein